MENTNHRPALGRPAVVPNPQNDSAAGKCIECGDPTSAIVKWDGKTAYLCVPCGQGIRKGAAWKSPKSLETLIAIAIQASLIEAHAK